MDQKKIVKLVVTIPAYNEAVTVGQVIKSIPTKIEGIDCIDIVVINDGSKDETEKAASDAGANVVSFTHNKGLGAAFSQGFKSALALGADIIVNIDADGQFNTNDIPKLIKPIIQGQADMVTASRFADKNLIPEMPWIKKWGNFRVANIVNNLTGQKLHDVSCGFRAYSRDAALRATLIGGHTYTHEIILELAFRGLKIVEVPVEVIGVRKVGKSKVASNLWKYGWNSLIIMLRAFRDYKPMKVFGGISLLFLVLAIITGVFVSMHFIVTGAFRPFTFVAFFSGAFAFIALIGYITALLAGMINRLRILQDEQLFLLRKQEYDKAK
ncbi:MAG TPA: glycosyltransferase family 2 protein [Sedimentisphaerales bacterium]|nr:glycosyltransferase family 2 protein [Sedimentisphaerales bacterium]